MNDIINGTIIDFPSGRRVNDCRRFTQRNVSELVDLLIGEDDTSLSVRPRDRRMPIYVHLEDLTGVDDETIRRLKCLAERRSLTPATAINLAVRHAREAGPNAGPRELVPGKSSLERYRVALSENSFGSFALCISGNALWVALASNLDYENLRRVCPGTRDLFVLHIDSSGVPPFRVNAANSRITFGRLQRISSNARAKDDRYVLVVGGIPKRCPARTRILLGLRRALQRNRNVDLNWPLRSSTFGREPNQAISELNRELINLVKIAFPGLLVTCAAEVTDDQR
jgi:hypothetical protein